MSRLAGRPQLILSESFKSNQLTKKYIKSSEGNGQFTFMETGFRNHNDEWILRPSHTRKSARAWLEKIVSVPKH